MRVILCSFAFLLMVQYSISVDPAAGYPPGGEFHCIQCDNLQHGSKCGHGSDVDKAALTKPCNNDSGIILPQGKEFKFCRKIVTIIDFDVNSNKATERIKRTCGYEESNYTNTCYYRAGLGGRVTVCTCTEPDCNTGTYFMPSALAVCLSIITALLVKFS